MGSAYVENVIVMKTGPMKTAAAAWTQLTAWHQISSYVADGERVCVGCVNVMNNIKAPHVKNAPHATVFVRCMRIVLSVEHLGHF